MQIRSSILAPALALGALLAFGQPVVHAQRPGGPPPGGFRRGPGGGRMDPSRMADGLARALNLTPAQKAKLTPILTAQQAKMTALFQDTKTPPQQKGPKFRALMQASMTKINAILTPAQRQKLAAMRQRRPGGPGGPGGPGRPGGPGAPGGHH